MAKFLTGKDLEKVIYDIIWDADQTLLIVSPYIKLGEYFKKLFDKHVNNPKIHFILVFGKNEGDVSKSLSKSDFDYFKKFLNISIIYVPNLHAKYYGNELKGVITSINLHDYSFINNIEFGVYSEVGFLDRLTTTSDQEAWTTCRQIAEDNEAVFIKRPVYEKKWLSAVLGKSYIKSDILHDTTEKFYSGLIKNEIAIKKIIDFPDSLDLGSAPKVRPEREEVLKPERKDSIDTISEVAFKTAKEETVKPIMGFCIRTGEQIPFNPKRPLSDKAYKNWAVYSNPDFQEKFCHFSGEPSEGKTSFSKPILSKNWKKAKEFFHLV